MKTDCKFMGGPSDGKTIAVENQAGKVSVPGMDYGCLVSHEYVRVGPAKFEFTETKKGSFFDEFPTNLDYVLGLREQRVALEAENAAMREALSKIKGHAKNIEEYMDEIVLKSTADYSQTEATSTP